MNAEELQEEGDVVEVYLLFCNNILSLFEEVVKNLEKDDNIYCFVCHHEVFRGQ